jgi:hypothetical protein
MRTPDPKTHLLSSDLKVFFLSCPKNCVYHCRKTQNHHGRRSFWPPCPRRELEPHCKLIRWRLGVRHHTIEWILRCRYSIVLTEYRRVYIWLMMVMLERYLSNDLNLLISDSVSYFPANVRESFHVNQMAYLKKHRVKIKPLSFRAYPMKQRFNFQGWNVFSVRIFQKMPCSTAYDGFFRVYAIVCNYIFDAFGNR